MAVVDNLKIGRPQTDPGRPSHVIGVREGNEPGSFERDPGHTANGRATGRRSTGINPQARHPIDPRMPVLTPA